MTAAIEGQNLKMGLPPSGQGVAGEMIFRGDRREMIMVDHSQKSYLVMDEDAIQQIAGQMSDAMKQMEAALANVPPEQRAMVEQMMRGRGMMPNAEPKPKPELRRTSDRASHSGFDTVKYEVLLEGRKTTELWVADWSDIDGYQEARPAFEAMSAFMKDLLDALAASPLGSMANIDTGSYECMTELSGFPVVTRDFSESGELETETTLTSARRETMSPDDFEPPSGYRRQQLPGGGGDR